MLYLQLQLILGLADAHRPSAPLAIQELNKIGVTCYMLTGDNKGSAQIIADKVGITEWIAGMKPRDKYTWIMKKQVLLLILLFIKKYILVNIF